MSEALPPAVLPLRYLIFPRIAVKACVRSVPIRHYDRCDDEARAHTRLPSAVADAFTTSVQVNMQ